MGYKYTWFNWLLCHWQLVSYKAHVRNNFRVTDEQYASRYTSKTLFVTVARDHDLHFNHIMNSAGPEIRSPYQLVPSFLFFLSFKICSEKCTRPIYIRGEGEGNMLSNIILTLNLMLTQTYAHTHTHIHTHIQVQKCPHKITVAHSQIHANTLMHLCTKEEMWLYYCEERVHLF